MHVPVHAGAECDDGRFGRVLGMRALDYGALAPAYGEDQDFVRLAFSA